MNPEMYPPDMKEVHPEDVFRTDIPGFDELFSLGGIPRGNIILIAGGPGAGKSTFCRQICNNASLRKQHCLYVSFEENVEKIERSMIAFGWDVEKFEQEGLLIIQKMNPLDILRIKFGSIEGGESATEISMKIEPITIPRGFKPDVIVVDSLTAMVAATISKARNYRVYLQQLFNFFEETKATTFLITETEEVPRRYSTTGIEEFLADGIVVLYNIKRGSVRENALEIVKMRYTKHQKKVVAFEITDRGIIVYPDKLVSVE
ncbi:MAG: AAA family ATPase [Thermoplasmata archaeon]|nr:MAG: AAA family ATPase [Thermoplasmata archaeon]